MGTTHSDAFEIDSTIIDLIEEYNIWSNAKICDKLESIYNYKLLQLDHSDLLKITYALKRSNMDITDIPKNKLCEYIICHYKDRINLLRQVSASIKECTTMIDRTKNGPVCRGSHEYIDEFFKCNEVPKAVWIDKIDYNKVVSKLKMDKRYNNFIKDLDKHYHASLIKIKKIIDIIKNDMKGTISNSNFENIKTHTEIVLKDLKTICKIYCLLIINFAQY